MKISTKGRYGLRVMTELAAQYDKGPISVEVIARNQELSANYVHLIVTALRSAGLIQTIRGPSGGCRLARPPDTITAMEVVTALEGPIAPVECVVNPESCARADRCPARDIWCDVASAISGVLSSLTLQELAARQRAKAEEAVNYYI